MPDDEQQEQESAQVVQQTADALFDGLLAFGEGMIRLGETIERLGVSLAISYWPINAPKIVPGRWMPTGN